MDSSMSYLLSTKLFDSRNNFKMNIQFETGMFTLTRTKIKIKKENNKC